jgi:hypothetical protein
MRDSPLTLLPSFPLFLPSSFFLFLRVTLCHFLRVIQAGLELKIFLPQSPSAGIIAVATMPGSSLLRSPPPDSRDLKSRWQSMTLLGTGDLCYNV